MTQSVPTANFISPSLTDCHINSHYIAIFLCNSLYNAEDLSISVHRMSSDDILRKQNNHFPDVKKMVAS